MAILDVGIVVVVVAGAIAFIVRPFVRRKTRVKREDVKVGKRLATGMKRGSAAEPCAHDTCDCH